MYIFAKFVADYIFLQNRDKINIKKFQRCICDIQSHFLLSLDNEFGTVPDKSYHQSRMPRFGKKVGNVLASPLQDTSILSPSSVSPFPSAPAPP
jgi:hypothetical protein